MERKEVLKSFAKLTGAVLLMAAVFFAGSEVGIHMKSRYYEGWLEQFEQWRKEDALSRYSDKFKFAYQFMSGGELYVGIYPRVYRETREMLEEHFCNEEFVRYVTASEGDMRRFEELMNEKEND